MRIGALVDQHAPVDDVIEDYRRAAETGCRTLWCSQTFDYDTLALLGVVGRSTERVELGTAVVPALTSHPIVLARQVLTAQAATGGRIVVGIGPSHRPPMEQIFGIPFDAPATSMREYLSVLLPVINGQDVDFAGKTLSASTALIHHYRGGGLSARYQDRHRAPPLDVPGVTAPPVLLAALGPRMLGLAGAMTQGTIAWMTGPALTETYIVPAVSEAASKAGRRPPRIVVGNRVCVTSDPDDVRDRLAQWGRATGELPSYRAVLDRQGAATIGDLAIIGDEGHVAREISRIADAGATDFLTWPWGTDDERWRTVGFVGSLAS